MSLGSLVLRGTTEISPSRRLQAPPLVVAGCVELHGNLVISLTSDLDNATEVPILQTNGCSVGSFKSVHLESSNPDRCNMATLETRGNSIIALVDVRLCEGISAGAEARFLSNVWILFLFPFSMTDNLNVHWQ